MAKAKKQALTPDELLEQVLVPESEQPYQVPENWVWTRLDCITTILNGYAFKSQLYSKTGIRVIRITNVQDGFVEDNKPEFYPLSSQDEIQKYMLCANDLLMSLTGNVGRVALLQSDMLPAALNQRVACIREIDSNLVIKQYIFYYLLRRGFIDECIKSSKGSAQLNMSTEWLKIYPFPLPPLPEQHRIVERIESLFEKLGRAKELAQNALDSFETRKAAILHKAFTGELTAEWREENSVGMESWEEKPLSKLCDSFQYGTSKKSEQNGEVVVIRMGNLQNGEIDWGNLAYTTDQDDITKYFLSVGDVLFNRTNSPELVGKTAIYRGQMPSIFAGYLIRINYNRECLDGYYLNYIMNSQRAKEYCSEVKSDGVNQSNINAKKLAAFTIPYCSIEEQQEIVRILGSLFEKEQRARELCDIIDKIDLMKKAILARAFRGELGTNDPSEESAIGLLQEKILTQARKDR